MTETGRAWIWIEDDETCWEDSGPSSPLLKPQPLYNRGYGGKAYY